LFSREANLVVSNFVLATTIHEICERNLFFVVSPSVRKYSISRLFVVVEASENEPPVLIMMKKAY
jgi:hypothetical protein